MPKANRRTALMLLAALLFCVIASGNAKAQTDVPEQKRGDRKQGDKEAARGAVRSVTIPISIRVRGPQARMELQALDFSVREDGEAQQVLSVRAMGTNSPLTVAVLIQDDVVPSIGNEIKAIADFIRSLPRGSRVLVGFIRNGSLEVRQKFTTDLERAASALRIPISSVSAAPFNPYVEIIEGLKRFDSQPAGRRAMLVISDGLDSSRGFDPSSITQSVDLQRAITEAQRRSVAIYSFYAPTVAGTSGNQLLALNAQGALQKLSGETGGRIYSQGTSIPVSFDPYLRELGPSLARQFAITYLSTHPKKGFHRIEILSNRTDLEIDHPAGYKR